jgi:hypothetical protein
MGLRRSLSVSGWQVTRMEFLLLWATYLAIMYTDLERGIGAGIVMATLYFAYSYAQACLPLATISILTSCGSTPFLYQGKGCTY